MLLESLAPCFGNGVGGIGLAPHKLLLCLNVAQFLQRTCVAGQVAIGQPQQRLQRGEIHRIVHHQHRHDAEPSLVFKGLVDGGKTPLIVAIFHD